MFLDKQINGLSKKKQILLVASIGICIAIMIYFLFQVPNERTCYWHNTSVLFVQGNLPITCISPFSAKQSCLLNKSTNKVFGCQPYIQPANNATSYNISSNGFAP